MLNTTDFKYWDLKYYYQIHCRRQKADGNIPLKYDQFIKRLRVMNLHDAIYTPRAKEVKIWESKTPVEDNIRRTQKLKEQNVQILDLDELIKIEHKYAKKQTKQTKTEKTEEIRPKQSLLDRFISLFR